MYTICKATFLFSTNINSQGSYFTDLSVHWLGKDYKQEG